MVGEDASHLPIGIHAPAGGSAAPHCILRDVTVMQIGERSVWVIGPVARQIAAWMEANRAAQLEPDLEREGHIGETATNRRATIHHHHGQGTHARDAAVRLRDLVRTRMRLDCQAAHWVLRTAGARQWHARPATGGHGDPDHRFARRAAPADVAVLRVELRLRIGEHFGRKGWLGRVVAPGQNDVHLVDALRHQSRDAKRCGKPARAGRRLVSWGVVRCARRPRLGVSAGVVAEQRITFFIRRVLAVLRTATFG